MSHYSLIIGFDVAEPGVALRAAPQNLDPVLDMVAGGASCAPGTTR